MGIFLGFSIAPDRIAQDEWEKSYEQALVIADKCNLMDKVITQRNGVRYAFARKTAERELRSGELGFLVCGTMSSGYNMEEFVLYRELDQNFPQNRGKDNNMDILLNDCQNSVDGLPSNPGIYYLWGGKTQGREGHLPLLAIACLLADQFPDAISVNGDVTVGQCKIAQEIVKDCLGLDIQLPVRCQAGTLAQRMGKVEIPCEKQLSCFFELYLGSLTEDIGRTLQNVFSKESVYDYFRGEFVEAYKMYQNYRTLFRDYFLLNFSFADLLKILVSDEKGCKMSLEEALKLLFSYNIHIPFSDKNCVDVLQSNQVSGDQDAVPSMEGFLGRALLSVVTGRNKNIPVYIPLEKIREDALLLDSDANNIIDRILDEQKTDERQEMVFGTGEDSLMSLMMKKAEQIDESKTEEGEYDISTLEDLFHYNTGCSFSPRLEKAILDALRKMQAFDIETDYEAFLNADRIGREDWFLRHNRYVLFPETLWEHIFEHIMEDEYIRRYYLVFCVDCSSQRTQELIESLMSSVELFNLLWGKAQCSS